MGAFLWGEKLLKVKSQLGRFLPFTDVELESLSSHQLVTQSPTCGHSMSGLNLLRQQSTIVQALAPDATMEQS